MAIFPRHNPCCRLCSSLFMNDVAISCWIGGMWLAATASSREYWCLQEHEKNFILFQHLHTSAHTHTHTHTHIRLTALFPGTTRVSRYQKGKTNLDFTEARDSEWQWHQLGHMQVCTSRQTDNHASNPPLSCLQAVCPTCHPIHTSAHTHTPV